MRAIVVSEGVLSVKTDWPQPSLGEAEALIRLSLAGICSTDLEIVKGYAGFSGVLGHEFVGVVEQCDQAEWVGRRVVGTINLGCRTCPVCLAEGPEHCPNRRTLGIRGKDGAFADYLTLPVLNLVTVPEDVPDEVAVFTEPFAAALRIREQLPIHPTHRLAVVGPGRLGLLIGRVLALNGNEVVMLGRTPASLVLPQQWGLKVGYSQDYPADAFDLVVEATGNENGLRESLRLVRPRGTLILKSTFQGTPAFDLTKLVVSEINLVGSRCGPFAPALRLLATGQIPVREMIDGEYPLDEAPKAFAQADQPGTRKILLRP